MSEKSKMLLPYPLTLNILFIDSDAANTVLVYEKY